MSLWNDTDVSVTSGPCGEVGRATVQLGIAVSPEAIQGGQLEDDSGKDGEAVVLQVELLEAAAEGEGVGEAAEMVAVEGEGPEVAKTTDGGWEVAETGLVQLEVCQVGHSPELRKRGRPLVTDTLKTAHPR